MSSEPPAGPDTDDPVIDWYRRDLSARIVRVLVPAAAFVIVGSIAVGLGVSRLAAADPGLAYRSRPTFVTDAPAPRGSTIDYLVFFGGLALVIAGTGSTVLGLRRAMTNEDYLLIRASGLFEHAESGDRTIPWDEIESIRSGDAAVHIVLRDGEVVELTIPYAGITRKALAKRLAEAHRKGIWGLLRQ